MNGAPLYRVDPTKPVRYLGYATGSFVSAALANLFTERPLPRLTVYRNSMAEGLKAMALEGWGLTWVPESILKHDLESGRLVVAGGEDWIVDVEIRLYRKPRQRPGHRDALLGLRDRRALTSGARDRRGPAWRTLVPRGTA